MNLKKVISTFVLACMCLGFIKVKAQQDSFTIYYDSLWKPVTKDNAFYYTQFVKQDTFYKCTSYWAKNNRVSSRCSVRDTAYTPGTGNFAGFAGIGIDYYENGNTRDSIQFNASGFEIDEYRYRENGIIEEHIFYDKKGDKWLGQNYDVAGKAVGGYFIYQEPAKFPGGASEWQNYLVSHLRAKTPARNKAPVGLYTVVVSFLVDREGKITEVKAENDPGYGTAEEAVRVVQKGPSWIPAQQKGKNVIYRQKQSITFQVEER